ncbi:MULTISPECIES: methyltransferase family protein [Mycobacteriaceae]|jgi:protein-S-isoprenylcysteine O-methyltransferase Ste14|uniref:Isoprenylcysteine carboxyl methyltransferase n=4 Tax=Mycobacteriaceae TaxID=1762 RepID=A0A0F5MV29_9MYCO|nr:MULTISPECIES: isoprenylcysteine carboxylmethyltransferase family protein [Mycobacteriaceae]KKB98678.1 isoprenylcysteine carboxyl methyltransferase [Mycolicibacter arupensis]KRQ20753.1 isoprenylcysteine carboxyl methyltransferase [Mycobacteroides sp. H003]KRQ35171.1 isoprenylcysteine carboxyl methyltransferase [Mycobacteroides sp. H101]KRQ35606.1 isoprenylcysteine carboxyl methyltransferase [Mycobacteroides sp. H092]KRQ53421.1 isoprenylcysteine carboxyl methyltransferase [Mycobacteroides sp.
MATAALALYGIFIVSGFGWRSYRQWRLTGSTGMRGFHGRPGSLEWLAGAGFVVAILLGALAPLLQWLGVLSPVAWLDHWAVHTLGAFAAILGIAGTLLAQESMGESWRIGVDASETTRLIDNGVFKLVRNPIFTAMLIFGAGVALLAPNGLALLAFATLATSIELQVRIVEEPYLRRTHGLHYAEYTSRVGRFIPGLGRSSTTGPDENWLRPGLLW